MRGVARVGCRSHEHRHQAASLLPCVPSAPVVTPPNPHPMEESSCSPSKAFIVSLYLGIVLTRLCS